MFDKVKKKIFRSDGIESAERLAPMGSTPSKKHLYASRQNFGVNFGSVFVLEKFMYDSLFINDTTVELDAVRANIKQSGEDATREKLERHWNDYCSDSDWEWLKSKGVQSIRLPFGYWIVAGGDFTKGTSFETVKDVYKNAWNILKVKYIEKAAQYNISILLDLHAVPCGANTGDHSGERLTKANFWTDKSAQDKAIEICGFIAKEFNGVENIAGIQVVNEAEFCNDVKSRVRYYTKAINSIRMNNKFVPIVISDGWWADQWCKTLYDIAPGGEIWKMGVVVDEHVYRCFSDDDKRKNADQIIRDLDGSFLNGLSRSVDFIIGEYSCVLDGQTWDKTQGSKDDFVRLYGNELSRLIRDRASGSYFWSYKFQWGDGGEWGFQPMVNRGCIPSRSIEIQLPTENDFNQILEQAYTNHSNYWNAQNPNESYEHWRFKEGFTTAWSDCMEFAKFENSRIGRKSAWMAARQEEHIQARGASGFGWQWEHGWNEACNWWCQN